MNRTAIDHSFGLALLLLISVGSTPCAAEFDRAGSGFVAGGETCGQYLVFAPPLESPDFGERTLEICPAGLDASPFGWHDVDGVDGADFTDTEGNNAIAQEDRDGNNQNGFRPDGGPRLDFQFPLDLDLAPEEFVAASVTHTFYWMNLLHDVRYRFGFDEVAGNFQENNYGRGGSGGDRFTVDIQDPVGLALFSTPPDGIPPSRLELPEVTPIENALLTVSAPSSIAGSYGAAQGEWGGLLEPPIGSEIEITLDSSGTRLGCDPLVGFTPGNFALLFRGSCEFSEKALNAERAGASAAIIVNDEDALITMGPGQVGPLVSIPTVMVRSSDGEVLRNALPGVVAELGAGAAGLRDGALDNTILAHSYGHAVSTRLTGGPGNSSCLTNAEQMGEGWSDFDAIWHTASAEDTKTDRRVIGAYTLFEPPDGVGIRRQPYTTDLSQNPLTYEDIQTLDLPFGLGTVWASMLWEVYWNLVDKHGFDPDLAGGSGGNQIAMQLVTDGLKLQPCLPHFVDGRDAILSADLVNNGGANACEIWRGFAKRGLGLSADAGSSNSVNDGVEAFDIPLECGPDLNASGSCPGSVTLRAAGLSPGSSTFVASAELGSFVIPSGPCAGVELDISEPQIIASVPPQSDGTRTLQNTLGPSRCGQFVQVVDSTCRVSPVATVPAAKQH